MRYSLDETASSPSIPLEAVKAITKQCKSVTDMVPAVLLDMGVPGLAVARSLGRRGIPVLALDTKSTHWTHSSHFLTVLTSSKLSEPDYLLRILQALHGIIGRKFVLIPLHDGYARFLVNARESVSGIAYFPATESSSVDTLIDKYHTYQFCMKHQIPAPHTVEISNKTELQEAAEELIYPCLIKPVESRQWQHEKAWPLLKGSKVILVNNKKQLNRWYDDLQHISPKVILQEYIPGPGSNLVYAVTYVDHNGETQGVFVGRKLRMYPILGGRGCYVKSIRNDEVASQTKHLIGMLAYRGNIGIEFKLDPRDGSYKLIEINARFGIWDGFSANCGFDVIYAAYCDLSGRTYNYSGNYREGAYWINPEQDIFAALHYRRDGQISLPVWLKTWIKPHFSAVHSWDDPKPAIFFWSDMCKKFMEKAINKSINSMLKHKPKNVNPG